MANYRKIWSDTFGPIIKGFHVHHIIPRSEGGKDVLGNLIALHVDDHALIHEMRGDNKCSSGFLRMAGGQEFSDERRAKISAASMGREAHRRSHR